MGNSGGKRKNNIKNKENQENYREIRRKIGKIKNNMESEIFIRSKFL